MQFRGEIEAYSLRGAAFKDGTYYPGSYYERTTLSQAALSSAMGGSSTIVCKNWRLLRYAWKFMVREYSDLSISWDKFGDDWTMRVTPICYGAGEYGLVEFVLSGNAAR